MVETLIKKMLLTNKNIIYVTSQKTGEIFSKSVDVIDKISFSEVKVINGEVFVSQKKTNLFGMHCRFNLSAASKSIPIMKAQKR